MSRCPSRQTGQKWRHVVLVDEQVKGDARRISRRTGQRWRHDVLVDEQVKGDDTTY